MSLTIWIVIWVTYALLEALQHTKIYPLIKSDNSQKPWKVMEFVVRTFIFLVILLNIGIKYDCYYIELLWLVMPLSFLFIIIYNSTIGFINKRDITYLGSHYPDNIILKMFYHRYLFYWFIITSFSWSFNMLHEFKTSFMFIKGGYIIGFNIITAILFILLWKVKRAKKANG